MSRTQGVQADKPEQKGGCARPGLKERHPLLEDSVSPGSHCPQGQTSPLFSFLQPTVSELHTQQLLGKGPWILREQDKGSYGGGAGRIPSRWPRDQVLGAFEEPLDFVVGGTWAAFW